MKIQVLGSMGDELGVTAAVREAKRQRPDEMIQLYGRWNPEIWINNPYLNIGNSDDGQLLKLFSFERTHVGSRTQLNFKFLGLDLARIQDELPEFYFTEEELRSPIMVRKTARRKETRLEDLDLVLGQAPGPMIAVDPGAGWPSRRWPEARFGELTSRLAALGYTILQVGWQGADALPGVAHNLVSRLRLRAVARLLGRCALFIGNDSGYFHVAAAVGCPHVTVYGMTRRTCGPYPGTVAVVPPTECRSTCSELCGRSEPGHPGISHCMDEISVDQVLAAAQQALARPRPASRLVPALTKAQAYEQIQGMVRGAREIAPVG